MSEFKTTIEPDRSLTVVEHKIVAGSDFNGAAPALSSDEFVPYFDDTDGVLRMKSTAATPVAEGDEGGLFLFNNDKPIIVEHIYFDLGSSVAWTLKHKTTNGDVAIDGATGQVLRKSYDDYRIILLPKEGLKLATTSAAAAMWARVSVRLFDLFTG